MSISDGLDGYYPIFKELKNGEDQSAASHGFMFGTDLQPIKNGDEHIICIRTSLMNDSNNTIEKVMSAVRSTLESDIERRKKLA